MEAGRGRAPVGGPALWFWLLTVFVLAEVLLMVTSWLELYPPRLMRDILDSHTLTLADLPDLDLDGVRALDAEVVQYLVLCTGHGPRAFS